MYHTYTRIHVYTYTRINMYKTEIKHTWVQYSPGAIIVVFLPVLLVLIFGGAVRSACFNLEGVCPLNPLNPKNIKNRWCPTAYGRQWRRINCILLRVVSRLISV